MQPSRPLVSVVIPTHNRAEMVCRCIRSVLASDFEDLEVVVVDDASTDDTWNSLKTCFGDHPKVVLVHLDDNSFQAVARNIGVRHSRGSFLLFLDDDNTVAPDMCSRLVQTLRDHPELGLVAPVSVHVLSDGRREVWTLGSDFNRLTSRPMDRAARSNEADIPVDRDLLPTTYSPNAFCVRRETFEKVGGFDEAFVQIFEESDFGWRVLATGCAAAMVTRARTDHHGFLEPGCVPALRALGIEKPYRTWCFSRNRIWFVKRHFSFFHRLSVILLFAPLSVLWYGAVAIRSRRPDIAWAYAKGYFCGLFSPAPRPPAPLAPR